MDNQKKKTMKSRAKQFISFALILAIVICGAFAYLTATDSKKNVFTVGNVDIELIEEKWDENGNYEGELNLNMLPGEEIPKAPYIKNTGDNEAWVYVTVGVPTVYAENAEDITLESTDFNIPVNAYAIQDMYEGATTAEAVWNAYNGAENITDGFGALLENTAGRVEIFKIKNGESLGFNTTDWSQIGLYQVNGHNYYVFAYNTKLAAPQSEGDLNAQTAPVFTSVVLNPNINAIGTDVLFHSASTDNVDYFSAEDIGGDVAAEYYGDPDLSAGNFDYEGSIPSDYVPEDGDIYVFGQTAHVATFNSSASAWEITGTVDETISNNAEVPETVLGNEIKVHEPVDGEVYEDEYYTYTYNKAYQNTYNNTGWGIENAVYGTWGVRVKDESLTAYGPMKSEIYGKPVGAASCAFWKCKNLTTAPTLSENLVDIDGIFWACSSLEKAPDFSQLKKITSMQNAFVSCGKMTNAPVLPDGLLRMNGAFDGCSVLAETPQIPETVKYMEEAFNGCRKITQMPNIPNGVKSLNATFEGCKLLSETTIIPEGVTDLTLTFASCESLEYSPVIPSTVKNMYGTFDGCKSLKEAPEIPASVTDMSSTFKNCEKITVAPVIPDKVTSMNSTFNGCKALISVPNIGNNVTKMNYTFANCIALETIPAIPSGVQTMTSTFEGCSMLTGNIKIPVSVTTFEYTFDSTELPINLQCYNENASLIKAYVEQLESWGVTNVTYEIISA